MTKNLEGVNLQELYNELAENMEEQAKSFRKKAEYKRLKNYASFNKGIAAGLRRAANIINLKRADYFGEHDYWNNNNYFEGRNDYLINALPEINKTTLHELYKKATSKIKL